MTGTYDEVVASLRTSYDAMVEMREAAVPDPWKETERSRFLAMVREEGRRTLLEVGAGTGVHGRFFADNGLEVVCSDASAAMVEACRAKSLEAYQADFLALEPSGSYDALFGMNCLLHVPPPDLGRVLQALAATLVPGGLAYLGQYGGLEEAGVFEGDTYEPKRYFSWRSDDAFVAAMGEVFDVLDFRTIDVGGGAGHHYQAAILRSRT